MADFKVMATRKTLFGSWEGNWLAFNTARGKDRGGTPTRAQVAAAPQGSG